MWNILGKTEWQQQWEELKNNSNKMINKKKKLLQLLDFLKNFAAGKRYVSLPSFLKKLFQITSQWYYKEFIPYLDVLIYGLKSRWLLISWKS